MLYNALTAINVLNRIKVSIWINEDYFILSLGLLTFSL